MKNFGLIFILFLLSLVSVKAQRVVTGIITDTRSGEPIANVFIEAKNTKVNTYSNDEGKYEITLPKRKNILIFKHDNYWTKTITEISNEINIKMIRANLSLYDLSLEEMLQVKVTTACKKEETISDIPASVEIISRSEIEINGYRTLEEILENVSGVNLIDYYGIAGLTLGMRGFWSANNQNVIIMINGISQRSEFSDEYNLRSLVPVEAIDRVEIIKGPISVIYGSGAFFGAINIITKTRENNETNIISTSYGTQNTKRVAFSTSAKKEDFAISANGLIFDSDGWDLPFDKMTSNEDEDFGGSNFTTQDLNWKEKRKNFSLSSSYKGFSADLRYFELERPYILLYGTPIPDEYNCNRKRRGSIVAMAYKNNFSEKFGVETKFLHSNIWEYGTTNWYAYEYSWSPSTITSQYYDIELNTFITPSPNFDITTGITYHNVLEMGEVWSGYAFNAVHHVWKNLNSDYFSTAIFTQLNYKVTEKLKCTAGIRLEQYSDAEVLSENYKGYPPNIYQLIYKNKIDKSDIQVVPRFAVIYKITVSHILKLLYGNAIKQPAWIRLGDEPTLSPERINTYEINYIGALSSNISLILNLYKNDLYDLIYRKVWTDDQGQYHSASKNEGEMNTYGAEIGLKISPTDNLKLNINVSYQETKDQKNDNQVPGFSPSLLGNVRVSYELPANITVTLMGNYVDEMESLWDVSTSFPEGHRIGDRVDSYFNFCANLRASDLFSTGLYVDFRAANLLDAEIHYPTYTESRWADKGTMGQTRNFLFTLGYKF